MTYPNLRFNPYVTNASSNRPNTTDTSNSGAAARQGSSSTRGRFDGNPINVGVGPANAVLPPHLQPARPSGSGNTAFTPTSVQSGYAAVGDAFLHQLFQGAQTTLEAAISLSNPPFAADDLPTLTYRYTPATGDARAQCVFHDGQTEVASLSGPDAALIGPSLDQQTVLAAELFARRPGGRSANPPAVATSTSFTNELYANLTTRLSLAEFDLEQSLPQPLDTQDLPDLSWRYAPASGTRPDQLHFMDASGNTIAQVEGVQASRLRDRLDEVVELRTEMFLRSPGSRFAQNQAAATDLNTNASPHAHRLQQLGLSTDPTRLQVIRTRTPAQPGDTALLGNAADARAYQRITITDGARTVHVYGDVAHALADGINWIQGLLHTHQGLAAAQPGTQVAPTTFTRQGTYRAALDRLGYQGGPACGGLAIAHLTDTAPDHPGLWVHAYQQLVNSGIDPWRAIRHLNDGVEVGHVYSYLTNQLQVQAHYVELYRTPNNAPGQSAFGAVASHGPHQQFLGDATRHQNSLDVILQNLVPANGGQGQIDGFVYWMPDHGGHLATMYRTAAGWELRDGVNAAPVPVASPHAELRRVFQSQGQLELAILPRRQPNALVAPQPAVGGTTGTNASASTAAGGSATGSTVWPSIAQAEQALRATLTREEIDVIEVTMQKHNLSFPLAALRHEYVDAMEADGLDRSGQAFKTRLNRATPYLRFWHQDPQMKHYDLKGVARAGLAGENTVRAHGDRYVQEQPMTQKRSKKAVEKDARSGLTHFQEFLFNRRIGQPEKRNPKFTGLSGANDGTCTAFQTALSAPELGYEDPSTHVSHARQCMLGLQAQGIADLRALARTDPARARTAINDFIRALPGTEKRTQERVQSDFTSFLKKFWQWLQTGHIAPGRGRNITPPLVVREYIDLHAAFQTAIFTPGAALSISTVRNITGDARSFLSWLQYELDDQWLPVTSRDLRAWTQDADPRAATELQDFVQRYAVAASPTDLLRAQAIFRHVNHFLNFVRDESLPELGTRRATSQTSI